MRAASALLLGSALLLSAAACRSSEGSRDQGAASAAMARGRAAEVHGRRPRANAKAANGPLVPQEDGHPAPQGCRNRPSFATELSGTVRIDQYKGVQRGKNHDHEIAEGTLLSLKWTTSGNRVDTRNVHLAMNLANSEHPEGLPREIPLKAGQVIEITGEYLPSTNANVRNANGDAAVLQYMHSPCGYVVINGQKYE